MAIKLTFTFDADWYDSNDERYDWIVTGMYEPEQAEHINCLPEDATPYEGSTFEIETVKFDGMEGEPPLSIISALADKIHEQADQEILDWGMEE